MVKITRWISLIERCSSEYRNLEFKELGLGPTHHLYILYLCKNPGVSQDVITKVLHLNKSNVTRNLQALQDNEFIEKKVDETDKRSHLIFPTDKAFMIQPKILEKMHKWNDIILDGLSEEDKELLHLWLKKITDNACKYIDDNVVEDM